MTSRSKNTSLTLRKRLPCARVRPTRPVAEEGVALSINQVVTLVPQNPQNNDTLSKPLNTFKEDTEDDPPESFVHDGGLNFGKPVQANAVKAQALLDQAGGGLKSVVG